MQQCLLLQRNLICTGMTRGKRLVVIVGLPDAAVKESRDRVVTALTNSGFKFPMGRCTINLAPAAVRKEGPSFDLPIAVGMLAASDQLQSDELDNFIMVGELALTGAVRPVKGVLPIVWRARAEGRAGVLVPPENAAEAAVVEGLKVIPVANLREAVGFLEGEIKIEPARVDLTKIFDHCYDEEIDMAEVKGQESVNWKSRRRAGTTRLCCIQLTCKQKISFFSEKLDRRQRPLILRGMRKSCRNERRSL